MKLPLFQVDAFAGAVFRGNPAAVCPLENWLDAGLMQSIAAENNLSETAFVAPENSGYRIRWFTPSNEIDLCGHATLASGYVLFHQLGWDRDVIKFDSRSGPLTVSRQGDLLALDFPARPAVPCDLDSRIAEALGAAPQELLAAKYYLAVFDSEKQVRNLKPSMEKLASLDRLAVIVTAPGESVDFVSRFFTPAQGVPEDPVTGAAHCTLIPYWSSRLGKPELHAWQVSARGGELWCENGGDRVTIAGHAVLYLEGSIYV